MSLDPIVLRGSLKETIWGGDHLATLLGKTLPPQTAIGESWETALEAVATNPPYEGRTLGDITNEFGVRLYGSRARAIFGDRFPLLIKFLDAHAWLSVQVHPDDVYAAEHEGGKLGKTEAWRILRTEPNAQIIHGFAHATNRAEVEASIRTGQLESLAHYEPVQAGDAVLNHAGTLHATGAGIVLYEVQEYSDVTYRLYDFGRVGTDGKPRELHIPQSLDVLDYDPLPRHKTQPIPLNGPQARMLVVCKHFALAEVALAAGAPVTRPTDGTSCQIVSVIEGQLRITWGPPHALRSGVVHLGETVVLPAEDGTYQLSAESSRTTRLLITWVPTSDDPAVAAWFAAQD